MVRADCVDCGAAPLAAPGGSEDRADYGGVRTNRMPTMSDGRQFTEYRASRCGAPLPKGMSCYDYKDSLIRDADALMLRDRQAAASAVGGVWCAAAGVPGVELVVECSDRACTFQPTGERGPVGISTDNTRLQQ